jgi:DNA-dependent RNA polymerase auxiliary subunit epsilon
MIYKVYYQLDKSEIPVREKTQTIFMESNSEKDVRLALKDREINIEFVQLLQGPYLEYEQQQENFELMEIK